jgi:hypothetical protein
LLLLHKECENNDDGVTLEEDDNEKLNQNKEHASETFVIARLLVTTSKNTLLLEWGVLKVMVN